MDRHRPEEMLMRQIAYFSAAAMPQTNELIHRILLTARNRNRREDITGLLVAGASRYMQIIEGPSDAVSRLYQDIQADRRHVTVTALVNRIVQVRCFEGWSMAFRHEPHLEQLDHFPALLRHLCSNIDDGLIRRQVEVFANLFLRSAGVQNAAA